jgi:hypothetical protein
MNGNDKVSAFFAQQIEAERDELAGHLCALVNLCFQIETRDGWSRQFIEIEQASLPLRVGYYMRKKKREEEAAPAKEVAE